MHILAVDDDPIVLGLFQEYLRQADGFHLDLYPCAESGLKALRESTRTYDCILLDIMLPGMDGITLCSEIRKSKQHQSIPIIMVTSSQEVGLTVQAFSAGATDFITKPFQNLELVARVKSANMLNLSLSRANHIMSELTQLMKIQFEEAIELEADGVSSVLALENLLLRSNAERFSMSLFSLNVSELRNSYNTSTSIVFRHQLEKIGQAAANTLNGAQATIAYAGSGRFVGAAFGRRLIDCDALTQTFNTELAESWDAQSDGPLDSPCGSFKMISSQRIWSGPSATETLRDFLAPKEGFTGVSESEQSNLFVRLDERLSEPKMDHTSQKRPFMGIFAKTQE